MLVNCLIRREQLDSDSEMDFLIKINQPELQGGLAQRAESESSLYSTAISADASGQVLAGGYCLRGAGWVMGSVLSELRVGD